MSPGKNARPFGHRRQVMQVLAPRLLSDFIPRDMVAQGTKSIRHRHRLREISRFLPQDMITTRFAIRLPHSIHSCLQGPILIPRDIVAACRSSHGTWSRMSWLSSGIWSRLQAGFRDMVAQCPGHGRGPHIWESKMDSKIEFSRGSSMLPANRDKIPNRPAGEKPLGSSCQSVLGVIGDAIRSIIDSID